MLISKLYRASVAQWLERHIGTTNSFRKRVSKSSENYNCSPK